jgi:RNA polymerase sigma factor (sigma-70 family)
LDHLQVLFRMGTVGSLTDGELIERYLTGADEVAEAAFSALVDRHGALVLHACREVLGNSEDAHDAFQATFLVLMKRAGTIRARNSVASWLYGVARRVSMRAKTQSTRRRAHERKAIETREPDHATTSEGWHELHEEIARLPDRFREPIVLCYFEGLSCDAAAQRLGCARGTILSRLARGRERLRGRLVHRGVAPAIAAFTDPMPFVLASVPASLAKATVEAAALKGTAAGAFSVSITTLAERTLRTMMVKKIVAFAAAVVVGGGIGVGGLSLLARNADPVVVDSGKSATANPKAKAKPIRSDLANERLGEYVGMGTLTHPAVEPVRKGLGLTDAQLKVAKKLADERDPKRVLVMDQLPAGVRGLALQQLVKDLHAAIDRDAGDAMSKVLQPGQLARLDQMILTGHGVRALGYADVQQALHLTAEQKTKIDTIIGKHHEELRAISRRPGGLPQNVEGQMALEEELEPLRRKALDDALAVLTPEQKTIWQGLIGPPFVAGEEPPK